MSSRSLLPGLVGLALFLAGAHASAESREAAATELFDAGRDLLKAGDYAGACPKLAASLNLDPKVGTLARLAECEEHLGHLADAHGHWARAESLARSSHDPRLDLIRSELARIDRLVPKLLVRLDGPLPDGVALHVDGLDLGSASFGLSLPLEPGTHKVEVSAPNKETWTQDVATEEKGAVVTIEVPALPNARPAPAPVPVALRHPLRNPGFVVGGAGIATMGAGILVGLLVANKDFDESTQHGCSASVCTTMMGQDERTSALSAGNVATGVFIGGAVLTAVGVTLVLLPPARTPEAVSVRFAPNGVRGEF